MKRKECFLLFFSFLFIYPLTAAASYSRGELISKTLDCIEHRSDLCQNGDTAAPVRFFPAPLPPVEDKTSSPGEKTISVKGWSVAGGFNFVNFDYEETLNEVLLDQNFGDLFGTYLDLSYRHHSSWGRAWGTPMADLYFRYYSGDSTYDGHLSNGLPFTFSEPQQVYRYGIKLGGFTAKDDNNEVFGYVDIGHRLWNRGDKGYYPVYDSEHGIWGYSYGEQYWWTYFGLGGGCRFFPSPSFTWGFDLGLYLAPDSLTKMHADSSGGMTFDLGEVYGLELEFPLRWKLNSQLCFELIPYYTYWEITQSDPVDIGGGWVAIEPPSKTNVFGLFTGLRFTF